MAVASSEMLQVPPTQFSSYDGLGANKPENTATTSVCFSPQLWSQCVGKVDVVVWKKKKKKLAPCFCA